LVGGATRAVDIGVFVVCFGRVKKNRGFARCRVATYPTDIEEGIRIGLEDGERVGKVGGWEGFEVMIVQSSQL